jgi:hypothetical protein
MKILATREHLSNWPAIPSLVAPILHYPVVDSKIAVPGLLEPRPD